MIDTTSIVLSFQKKVTLNKKDDCVEIFLDGNYILRINNLGRIYSDVLDILLDKGLTLELIAKYSEKNKEIDSARLYFFIGMLEQHCLINYSLIENEVKLATLESANKSINFIKEIQPSDKLLLSRFAVWRREGFEWLLECPISTGQLYIHNDCLAACVGLLASPQSVSSISKKIPQISPRTLEVFISLLISMNALFKCDDAGNIPEDFDSSLRQWEPHDLLFHYRSRLGRHKNGYGATFRFKAIIPHVCAIKKYDSAERVALQSAESEHWDCSFFKTIESRRSKRERGKEPITVQQIGFFLWYVARVKQFNPSESNGYESTFRPVPSGGAMHEIDLYLTVNRCSGLAQGIYHYNPMSHELEILESLGEPQKALLQDAMISAGMSHPPDILFTLAARFGRMAWKYQSIAYAVTLKNAGVLYNQMYLVATAMGLAPCGLGGGNTEVFSLATKTSYYEEGSIGEFMLSSCDNEEP